MAEAVVQPRRLVYRFFCHRCNVEFEDVLQDYTCPYCATGFIERLEHERESDSFVSNLEDEEYSDADMSNLEDTSQLEETLENTLDDITRATVQGQPMLNDLAFLMTGGRLRPAGGARRAEGRTLMEQLVWMIGGGRGGTATVTAGAPFVLVGAPGDYVFGGEGLDAVVTQLLGQLENTGPPPLPREQIQAIPSEKVTAAQVEANMSCSVCWDNFTLDETVSRLECEHIFHPACISPWLQLHATCPVCRRSLLTAEQQAAAERAPQHHELIITPAASSSSTTTTQTDGANTPSYSRVVVRRVGARRRRDGEGARGLWSQLTSQLASAADSASASASASVSASASASASSLSSADRDAMYMDIDYD